MQDVVKSTVCKTFIHTGNCTNETDQLWRVTTVSYSDSAVQNLDCHCPTFVPWCASSSCSSSVLNLDFVFRIVWKYPVKLYICTLIASLRACVKSCDPNCNRRDKSEFVSVFLVYMAIPRNVLACCALEYPATPPQKDGLVLFWTPGDSCAFGKFSELIKSCPHHKFL